MSREFPRLPVVSGQAIGLLGGSFNPAHEGHLAISLVALKALRLDRIVWLVAPQNPLKTPAGMASLAERVERARAIAAHPRFIVSAIEAELGTRFTADTLAALKARHPGVRFVFLMGADNLIQLPRWERWTEIAEKTPIAVFARPGFERALGAKAARRYAARRLRAEAASRLAVSPAPAWVFVPTTHEDISATALRREGLWPPRNAPAFPSAAVGPQA